jgi:hypothetical protein
MRDMNGKPGAYPGELKTPYITITSINSGTVVQVQVTNVNGSQAGLVDSSATEPTNTPDLSDTYAKQYFDPGCAVHTPPIPACEHPGWVVWADGTNYLCIHGLCIIGLKP